MDIDRDSMDLVKIDIDVKRFNAARIVWVFEHIDVCNVTDVAVYKTKKGFHVYLRLGQTVDNVTMCMLQSLCGSDYRRESLNYVRIVAGFENWNVLFSEKYTSPAKHQWEKRSFEHFSPLYTARLKRLLKEMYDKKAMVGA